MDYYTWNPGPGTYKPKVELCRTQPPIYSMAIKTNGPAHADGPAPDAYNPCIIDRREPAYSLQGRGLTGPRNGNPGTGTYSPSILLTKRAEPQFSLAKKIDYSIERKVPGPGTYKPQRQGYGLAFSLGARFPAEKPSDYPGPETYKRPYVNWYKPGFTLGKRFPAESFDSNPGVGTYNPRMSWQKPGYTFAQRFPMEADQKFPGPGNYNDQYRSRPPAYTIAKRFLTRHNFVGPAPGDYSPHMRQDAPAFSLAARNCIQRDDGFPGAGTYDPKLWKRPGYTMASKLLDPPPFNVPGAGTYYNPKLDKYTGPAYSLTERPTRGFGNGYPGPGTYEAVREKGRGVLIAERLEDPHYVRAPGPGRYNLRLKSIGGPAFSIATRLTRKSRPGEKGYFELAPKTY